MQTPDKLSFFKRRIPVKKELSIYPVDHARFRQLVEHLNSSCKDQDGQYTEEDVLATIFQDFFSRHKELDTRPRKKKGRRAQRAASQSDSAPGATIS